MAVYTHLCTYIYLYILGPTCCERGTFCYYQSKWYSQCVPGVTDMNPSKPPSKLPPNENCALAWAKCGGESWSG